MNEKMEDLLIGRIFDAASAHWPLITCLIIALVEEKALPPRSVTTMFARARGIIGRLDHRELMAVTLEAAASLIRQKLSEQGYGDVPPQAPPEWWLQ